jgi:hypothetical protein
MKQFKELLRLFISLDFRDKEKGSRKKLIGIIIAYIFSNSFISLNNFNGFDEFSYAVLSFSVNIFFISFVVLNDFDSLFLLKNNFNNLSILPVEQKSFFTAKFISASLMIFTFFACSSVSQIIFFYFFDYSVSKVILFFLCSLLFNFTFMGLILLLYAIALDKFTEKSNSIVYILQIIFFVFVMYSSTAASKAFKLGKRNILDIEFFRYLPQVFFVKGIYNPLLLPVLLLIGAGVYFGVYKFMSANFFRLHIKVTSTKKKKKTKRKFNFDFWKDFVHKHILRNNIQTASYDLLKSSLRNSKFLRTKYFPVMLFPVIFTLLGIIVGPDFLLLNGSKISSSIGSSFLLLSPTITFMTIISVRMMYSNSRISDEGSPGSEMVFNVLPIGNPQHLNLGIVKFIYSNFYFPLMILMTLLLLVRIDLTTILVNLAYLTSSIYLLNTIFLTIDKRLPFSLESSKFNSASKFGEVLFNMVLGLLIFIIQIFVFQNVIFVIGAVIVFIGVSFLINRN